MIDNDFSSDESKPVDVWPRLDKPAMVGAGRFGVGVSTRLVVGAAQRLYEHEVTPEKEAQRIARARPIRFTDLPVTQADFDRVTAERDTALETVLLNEVRALLDEPSECRCKRYGKGNPHWPCPVHPVKPSAQHHGEPVAWMQPGQDAMCISNKVKLHSLKIGGAPASAVVGYSIPLYAGQPAPVAVVCAHEWTDDGEFTLVCTACEAKEDYTQALQHAFELGGTDDGAYHLEADELCEVLRLHSNQKGD